MEVLVGVDVLGDRPYSYAPISQFAPCGRETPRWSVDEQVALSPVLMANEPGSSAMLRVGPPLSASGASNGSPVSVGLQRGEPSSIRLFPMVSEVLSPALFL